MKLKLLLLFLIVAGFGVLVNAQSHQPINTLLITEVRGEATPNNYIEVTNMGTEKLDLAEFEIARFSPWPANADNWTTDANAHFRLYQPNMYPKNSPLLEKRYLDPGKSYLISTAYQFGPMMWKKDPLHYPERVTKKEFWKKADLLLHVAETNGVPGLDSITPNYNFLDCWWGYNGFFLRHHFINDAGAKDSMIIDVFNGQFDDADGTNSSNCDCGFDVAGVSQATLYDVLVRKYSVKHGITDFSSHDANLAAAKAQFNQAKGLDLNDSEWIPIPRQGWDEPWKAAYWTIGNSVDQKLDANLLESKTGKVKVDLANSVITVPWGVRRGDSLMFQFKEKPGLGWKYDLSKNSQADSAFNTATKGDILTLYVTGSTPVIQPFTIDVLPPTADDNIVVPKNAFDYRRMRFEPVYLGPLYANYKRMEITDGVKGGDTIKWITYGLRVDTLLKYIEKAPKASWKIVFKSGVDHPDLATGDKLRVTSESGKVKDYFIKCMPFVPQSNANLSAITWPDMPSWFKGDIAGSYGWKGDTIPGFGPTNLSYVVKLPAEIEGIPALSYTKQNLDSKVTVKRAVTLNGSPAERTITFTCIAEDDSTTHVYTVRIEKEKDPANIQPWIGDPFISQFVYMDDWANCWMELVNPGTEPLDLSQYMIVFSWGNEKDSWGWNNGPTEFGNAYLKYVPGKKWVDEANWQVTPRMLVPDLATNAIVYPGDVFVLNNFNQNRYGNAYDAYRKEVDIDFKHNPWGISTGTNLLNNWMGNWGGSIFLYKIMNDSVINGLKPATDRNDFELLEMLGDNSDGTNWVMATKNVGDAVVGLYRKPNIYKPNSNRQQSYGTTKENSEWTYTSESVLQKLNWPWPMWRVGIIDGIGSHVMDEVTIYKSTVSSKVYKVSPGYSMQETIKGVKTGTTVTDFFNNILKANPLQALKVNSAGKELAAIDAVSKGDELVVLSADSTNTSKYILDVTATGLSANAVLTATNYTVTVTGATGTVGGFKQGTLLKNVLADVVVPAGATLTLTDASDAYMTLTKLNYDTAYVNVIATDNVFFEVIAENGVTKINYQLVPAINASDAYVTSDVYSIDQFASLIQFVPPGTSVRTLLNNVTPAPGATMVIFDKAGFVRSMGDVYRDDKLIVTSKDGKVTKAYYFSMNNFYVNKYLAYVISDDYPVDQVKFLITAPVSGTDMGTFLAKLYPSFGATLTVLDKNGAVSKLTTIVSGDKLLVTAADGFTTATYSIKFATGVPVTESLIKMYPNPTTDRVIIRGLTEGNRVQVFNSVGVTLRDVIVNNATEYVSLAAQPAGIYVFVISSGDKFINIQKIVKE